MHTERRTAVLRLYNLMKGVILSDRYCRLHMVFDEQLLRTLYT